MKKLFKGFTLAEVLVTLAIIGVVAAVTLPALQVNVNKQALSTQISKTYSQLQEGLKLYMSAQGLDQLDTSNFDMNTFARNHLQVQYVCNGKNDSNCFADTYTSISGNKTKSRKDLLNYSGNVQAYILKDGTTLAFIPQGIFFKPGIAAAYVSDSPSGSLLAANWQVDPNIKIDPDWKIDPDKLIMASFFSRFIVDVNGKKGPNKIGYDLFDMSLNTDGSIGPSVSTVFTDPDKRDSQIATAFANCKTGSDSGAGCFNHLLLNNFKFDY